MEKMCKNCRFYREGMCKCPIWKDGELWLAHDTKPESVCYLFEEKPDALSV